jgi:hypothetical protein
MRFESPSMTELSSLLLAHEAKMLSNLMSLSSSTVNLTINSDNTTAQSTDSTAYYSNDHKPRTNPPKIPLFRILVNSIVVDQEEG